MNSMIIGSKPNLYIFVFPRIIQISCFLLNY